MSIFTVEPLKEDPPRKGHCIKYLSTMDKTKSPNLSLPINIMRDWNLLKEDNLYKGDKPLEFILVPKCPFLGGSTVYIYMFVDKKKLNRTLAIDSPFQTFAVGLLVEFID